MGRGKDKQRREVKPLQPKRAQRYATRRELLDATRVKCKAKLGPYELIVDTHFWELDLGEQAARTVKRIDTLVSELESAQLIDWVKSGGEVVIWTEDGKPVLGEDGKPAGKVIKWTGGKVPEGADGVFYPDADDAPPDYLSDQYTPAHNAARTLRAAVDKARAGLGAKALDEYVKQYPDLDAKDVAVRAIASGYEYDPADSDPQDLTVNEVIQRVTNAVRAARKRMA